MKSIQISDELHTRVKVTCSKRAMKINSFIEKAIENLLKELEEGNYITIKGNRVIEEYYIEDKKE